MRVAMRQTIETVWANSVEIEVSSELDNPSMLTTKEIAALAVFTIHVFVEQVRSENERVTELRPPSRGIREHLGTFDHQEEARFEHMVKDRDQDAKDAISEEEEAVRRER